MLCFRCGQTTEKEAPYCAACDESREREARDAQEQFARESLVDDYAGFWLRLIAHIIDWGIISFPVQWTSALAGRQAFISAVVGLRPSSEGFVFRILAASVLSLLTTLATYFAVAAIYYAAFECSPLRATPGKLICGLTVTDREKQRLSFGRAFVRSAAKLLSTIPFFAGYIAAAFTVRKQALHDLVAGALVWKRRSTPWLRAILAMILVLLSSIILHRQSKGSLPYSVNHEPPHHVSMNWETEDLAAQGAQHEQAPRAAAVLPVADELKRAALATRPVIVPRELSPRLSNEAGIDGRVRVKIRSVAALYYEATGVMSISFYEDELTPDEIATLQSHRSLSSTIHGKAPVALVSMTAKKDHGSLSSKAVTQYTTIFFRHPGETFDFVDGFDRVSFGHRTSPHEPSAIKKLEGEAGRPVNVALEVSEITARGARLELSYDGSIVASVVGG